MKINNLKKDLITDKFVIFRIINGVAWYYGSGNDLLNLSRVVCELGKQGNDARIIETSNIDNESLC